MATQDPVSKSKPVRLFGTILAVLVAAQAYTATIDAVPDWVKWVIGGAIVLITAGLGYWTQGQTVPFANVAARVVDETGEVIAGPAAEPVAGVATGDAVQVTTLPPV
jgi:hypothetical protein